MPDTSRRDQELKPFAASTLDAFSKIASTAGARLRQGRQPINPDVIANLNDFNDPAPELWPEVGDGVKG